MRPEDIAFEPAFDRPAGRDPVRVRWLGTAGFEISHGAHTLLIDPYLTRASLFECVRAPLRSDIAAIRAYVPRADVIIAGHTHFDHVLDVPAIARLTGAKVLGSRSCVNLCRIERVSESQLVDVESRSRGRTFKTEVGPFVIRLVPSCHSALLLGRVPAPGDIADCEQVPLRTHGYRCGAVFSVDVRVAGRRIYHLGSADLIDENTERDVDLLLMCVAGWTTTRRFSERVLGRLRPDAILLSHWDNFFSPVEHGAKMLPAMQMPRLLDRLTAIDPSVRIGTVGLMDELTL